MLLGAKYAPCMRADQQLLRAIEREREAESLTGCCVYNTGSGCYQSTQEVCRGVGWHGVQQSVRQILSHLPHLLSPTPPPLTYPTPLTSASPYPKALTTFVYNDSSVNPPQPSRVVCGQSPRTCLSPASNPPQTWDQNIVNWPVGGAVAGGWGCGRWVWVQLASNAIDSACG